MERYNSYIYTDLGLPREPYTTNFYRQDDLAYVRVHMPSTC